MRHYLRYDAWICMVLSFIVALAVGKGVEWIANKTYAGYEERHTAAAGEIGGVAGEDVFRAQNVEDLLTHDTFTVISPGVQYTNAGGGYYGNRYLDALTLPSGERIAAYINAENAQSQGETIYDGDTILPVGCVVYEDLTKNQSFLTQIQHACPLSRTDFYVDMAGAGARLSRENYTEVPVLLSQVLTVFILFPLLHAWGAGLGIFPYYFPPGEK